MIDYNKNILLENSGVRKIMNDYNVSRKVASYLILVYPCEDEFNKWNEYESAKEFLEKQGLSSKEYENAIKYLTNRLRI